jgi:hypothetical protein
MQDIKRKRALAVSAALALVLALGACTDDPDDGGTDGTDDLGGVTTTFGDTATTMAPTTTAP